MPVIPATQEVKVGFQFQRQPGKCSGKTLSQKQNTNEKAWAVLKECLSTMGKAVGSILSATKEQKEGRRRQEGRIKKMRESRREEEGGRSRRRRRNGRDDKGGGEEKEQ
jgi:hypothetical protein